MTQNKFKQLIINTDNKTANIIADLFNSLKAISVTIEDQNDGNKFEEPIFNEPGIEIKSFWQHSRVKVLCFHDTNVAEKVNIIETLLGIKIDYELELIDDQDWVAMTKDQFKPIEVTPNFYIVPSWHESPSNVKKIILDPGLAFGTGSHATTFMCLKWISKNVTPTNSLLDYGCGSGILAIAAKIFGAKYVVGTDIDEQAIIVSNENKIKNNVEISFIHSSELKQEKFDYVVANILLNPIISLLKTLYNLTQSKLVLTGILEHQVEEVILVYNKFFNITVLEILDGWALLECNIKKDYHD